MAGVDPTAIMQFAQAKGQYDEDIANHTAAVEINNSTIANASADQIVAAKSGAVASGQIQREKDSVQLATSSADAMLKSMMGVDPGAANYRLATLAQQRADAYDKTNELSDKIAKKQQATLLSDPLGYINNAFTLPADIALHNHYAELHNNAEAEYDGIVASTTKAGQMNKAMEATMTTAQAQANQDSIAATAQAESDKLKIQGAQLSTAGIQELQSLSKDSFSGSKTAIEVADAQARIAAANAARQASLANLDLTMQLKKRALAEDAINDAGNSDMYNSYLKGAQTSNAPILPRATVLARLRSGKDADMADMVSYGQQLLAQGGDKNQVLVAANAGAAAEFYIKSGARPVGTDASTINFIASQANAALLANPATAAIKDRNERALALAAPIKQAAAQAMSSIDPDDVKNPYQAVPLKAVMLAAPNAVNTPFVQNVLKPAAASNPDQNLSPEQVLAAADIAIKADPSQLSAIVSSIEQLFSGVVRTNNGMKSYGTNGLDLQNSFNAKVSGPILGGNVVVDMMNPNALKTYFMKKQFVGNMSTTPGYAP